MNKGSDIVERHRPQLNKLTKAQRARAHAAGMKLVKWPRGDIEKDRWSQISNNVAEEYIDLGQTNFATKEELCETIFALNRHYMEELQRKDGALHEIAIAAFKAARYDYDATGE